MTTPDQHLEAAIVAAGANVAPRITPADIEANIASEHYFTAEDGVVGVATAGTRTRDGNRVLSVVEYEEGKAPGLKFVTICVLILKNGTKVVGVNEGPVSPENFNPELGRQYARQKAIDQIWPMLGYELRTKLAGF